MIKCDKCGLDGHIARDCQYESDVTGRPTWCGECDKRTRLVDHGAHMQRCYRCWAWPAKGTRHHQHLPQHHKCGGCGTLIYAWDTAACGGHQPLALDAHGHRVAVTLTPRLTLEGPP